MRSNLANSQVNAQCTLFSEKAALYQLQRRLFEVFLCYLSFQFQTAKLLTISSNLLQKLFSYRYSFVEADSFVASYATKPDESENRTCWQVLSQQDLEFFAVYFTIFFIWEC
ncbi:hypothetical protein AVEN_143134-1 [Araneus ventricosus]|uniref:Uncharacterized protein n=1 Tax=Araneus ventricosus TaxID=182803 RepID=A0A4Y2M8S2_ARAVE|nr:hypothetical protein AVEN_143134-1 [Araneus ventricosus]